MADPLIADLLAGIRQDNLDLALVLADLLEERGDARAEELRRLHAQLYDLWMFAPFAFGHYGVMKDQILRLFPEQQP